MGGRHVVLNTPTGSGKSLVALALHFKAMCEGKRSVYTSPVKALASEKFFALCRDFGAENVGMLTGDASINRDAPIICCTAEVLSNMALREGEATDAPYVVMDEFHFYDDPERGSAWQVPLLVLRDTTFLLMSATLGNTWKIEQKIRERTGREVASIYSDERPVPLDYEYRETPLHETIGDLLEQGRAPIYIVNFTQRECAEQAQALTSLKLTDRAGRERLAQALGKLRAETPYGKEFQRFIRHGVGVHHAGLLPRYRLLVEQLAQQGLLRVICGTDTLGVGVNIPIRTVLFAKLCKFDGRKVSLLRVREFKQIAGRAGRRGFDQRGSVVAQAPEHVIENKRRRQRAEAEGSRKRKPASKKPPARGFVSWDAKVFERLASRPPEPLESRFRLTHGMVLNLLQRESDGYRRLVELLELSHEDERSKARLRRLAAALFRSLRAAEIVKLERDPATGRRRVVVSEELQRDFSLHQTLSLYLVDSIERLDVEAPSYPLDLLGLIEAILENPSQILYQQEERAKRELLAELKAAGVPYEERLRELEQVSYPRPNAEFIYATFDAFAEKHPWVRHEDIRPKWVAGEMFDGYYGFDAYVREHRIQRSEGLLLRYLSQVYNTLVQSVPDAAKTEGVHDVLAFFRALLERVDSSLVEKWQDLVSAEAPTEAAGAPPRAVLHPAAFRARVRAELHRLVEALSRRDYEEAARCVRHDPLDAWPEARLEGALAPFYEEYEKIVWEPRARLADRTRIQPRGPGSWDVVQVLVDPEDDNMWCIEGEVHLVDGTLPEGPAIAVRRIGT